MKQIKPTFTIFTVILCALFGLQSCIYDDRDGCTDPRGNVRLLVKLDTEIINRNEVGTTPLDSITLYVFDQSSNFVTSAHDGAFTNACLTADNNYEFWLQLDPGQYQFVIWTNQGDYYTTLHTIEECTQYRTSMRDMQLYLKCPEDQCFRQDIPDLHYGIYRDATVVPRKDHVFLLSLVPNTHKLNFTVEGLPACEDEYNFTVTDNNSHYSFDNNIVADRNAFNHIRTVCFETDSDLIKSSMKVLRLTADRHPSFAFQNLTTGESHYTGDLVQMITKAYQANSRALDFDTTYEFDIKLTFNSDLSATVTINGWDYTYQPGELQ